MYLSFILNILNNYSVIQEYLRNYKIILKNKTNKFLFFTFIE